MQLFSSEYGERDPTVVKADIDNYNSWDGDLALDGVFVDELNPEYDDALNKYTQYSEWIRSGFGGSGYVSTLPFIPSFLPSLRSAHLRRSLTHHVQVMMNPGSNVDGSFYAISDMIISYESGYDKYEYVGGSSSLVPSALLNQPADPFRNLLIAAPLRSKLLLIHHKRSKPS